jgi:hypothetical protein
MPGKTRRYLISTTGRYRRWGNTCILEDYYLFK